MAGAVVEADERLGGDRDAHDGHEGQVGEAVDDADGGQGGLGADGAQGAVLHQLVVDGHVAHAGGNLQQEARHAEGEDLPHHGGRKAHVGCAQLERGLGRDDEVPQHADHRDAQTAHRSQGRTRDTPAQHHDEEVVEADAGHGADHHGEQGAVGSASGADEVVDAHADDLRDAAHREDPHVDAGLLVDGRRGGGKREQRVHAGGDVAKTRDDHRDDDGERERVAEHALGVCLAALAQAQRCERVAAVAHEHGQRHEEDARREGRRGHGKARLAHGLAQEGSRDDVVGAVDEHADDRGDGKLQQQLGHRLGTHAEGLGICLGVVGPLYVDVFVLVDLVHVLAVHSAPIASIYQTL